MNKKSLSSAITTIITPLVFLGITIFLGYLISKSFDFNTFKFIEMPNIIVIASIISSLLWFFYTSLLLINSVRNIESNKLIFWFIFNLTLILIGIPTFIYYGDKILKIFDFGSFKFTSSPDIKCFFIIIPTLLIIIYSVLDLFIALFKHDVSAILYDLQFLTPSFAITIYFIYYVITNTISSGFSSELIFYGIGALSSALISIAFVIDLIYDIKDKQREKFLDKFLSKYNEF